MARPDEIGRHGTTHVAEPNEGDRGHLSPPRSSLRLRVLGAGGWRKVLRHVIVADLRQRRLLPARCVVLVDHDGADALVKIVAADDVRGNAELETHGGAEVERAPLPYLGEGNLQAGRRFLADL